MDSLQIEGLLSEMQDTEQICITIGGARCLNFLFQFSCDWSLCFSN